MIFLQFMLISTLQSFVQIMRKIYFIFVEILLVLKEYNSYKSKFLESSWESANGVLSEIDMIIRWVSLVLLIVWLAITIVDKECLG